MHASRPAGFSLPRPRNVPQHQEAYAHAPRLQSQAYYGCPGSGPRRSLRKSSASSRTAEGRFDSGKRSYCAGTSCSQATRMGAPNGRWLDGCRLLVFHLRLDVRCTKLESFSGIKNGPAFLSLRTGSSLMTAVDNSPVTQPSRTSRGCEAGRHPCPSIRQRSTRATEGGWCKGWAQGYR